MSGPVKSSYCDLPDSTFIFIFSTVQSTVMGYPGIICWIEPNGVLQPKLKVRHAVLLLEYFIVLETAQFLKPHRLGFNAQLSHCLENLETYLSSRHLSFPHHKMGFINPASG